MVGFTLHTRNALSGVPAPDEALFFAPISLYVDLLAMSTRLTAICKLNPPTVDLDQKLPIPCVVSAIAHDAAADYHVHRDYIS